MASYSTADRQVVSNVYQIKSVPIELQDLAAIIVAVLSPFVPILFFEIPLNVIFPISSSCCSSTTLG